MNESNCLIIAGEKSGEQHCLSFYDELRSLCPQTHFWGVGGDDLKDKGMEILYHLKDFSSWGISEVIGKIPFYMKALKDIELQCLKRKTKVAILIDFQDFNLRLAKKLNKHGVKVLYYVAPQAWAWKAHRAQVLEETVHSLFTIIPFERDWFEKRGVNKVISVNHPLLKTHEKVLYKNRQRCSLQEKINLLILPGSRNFEVRHLLPIFIKTLKLLKKKYNVTSYLVQSPNVNKHLYSPYEKEVDYIHPHSELEEVMEYSNLALAASGTITLSTALMEIPTIVCYQGSLLNEFVYQTFIDYKGPISLANIVHQELVFPELLQERVNSFNLFKICEF
ncbi:MAG: lipid-A-disaccharide synthase, partial [Bdellovibrionales bacterium]|nr:lipid-A-disaccharide synthase [Bdellovibrionales bacterium]